MKIAFISLMMVAHFTLGNWVFAQERTIRGEVTDAEDGQSLPGVNVIFKGSQQGTLTNSEGQYTLTLTDSITTNTLVFSFVGYETQEVPIGNSEVIDITMNTEAQELEEVVVVGYGTIDRKKLASSISSIGSEQIEGDPVAGLNQAVQGKMAGVQVTQNSGTPGGGLNFRIRGINTINSSTTEPLYVVDGVPVNTDNFTGINRGGRQSLNLISAINPADISSIEVLKDASATAIYGARAANGVVLITTKRGSNGENRISLNAYYGVQELPRQIEMANADQYIGYAQDLYALNEVEPNPALFDRLADTNWQDAVYRTAPLQSYTLSASGGTEKTTYYLSGSYFDQQGIVLGSSYQRINLRTNLEHELNDRVTFGANVNLTRNNNNRVPEDFGRSAPVQLGVISRPNIPVYDENGAYYIDPVFGQRDNAVAVTQLTQYEDVSDRVIGNVYADIELLDGLTFRTNWGVDKLDLEGDFYIPQVVLWEGIQKQGFKTLQRYRTFTWLNENVLTYTKDFGKHDLTVLVGNTLQQADIDRITINATTFPSDQITLAGAAGVYTTSDYVAGWSLASVFSRINYVYNDRYILTANYRIDGSSRFGSENKYANFPSVALAWRVSEEAFLQGNTTFSELKLRGSWGQSGNQPRDFYEALPLYGVNAYYGGSSGYSPSVIGNNQLAWETTTQFNIGLDMGLFDDRISVIADYYQKNTDDLLVSLRLPEATGTLFTLVNMGSVRNTGFEFELNSTNLVGEFRWNTSLNMSFPKNEVTSLPGGDIPDGMDDASHYAREGYPIGSFYGYIAEGVDPATGNVIYADVDGDGERSLPGALDPEDRTIIGNPHPDFYGGITNSFYWNNFDLSIQGQFVYGNDIWNFTRREYESLTGPNNNISVDALDYWKSPGDQTEYPKPTIGASTNALLSTRWIEDGSFFRIRDLTLGYSLPQALGDRMKIDNVRIYAQVQNLYNFTNYSGYDPEISVYENRGSMIGADFGSYPRARTFLLGVNLTF
ncbi:MAG: TonB-dependent receptor [Cyclobacteriaceae bacterium]